MKTNIYTIIYCSIAISVSCTKSFEDFNTDVKNPATVTGEALFSKAQISLVDQVNKH